jgi:ATP-dependent Clp protease ATP-binding subunit ClpB
LKRVIQRSVETPLAKKIMAGEVPDGSAVGVVVANKEIAFHVTPGVDEGETLRDAAQAG